jgi:hypothetical protein
MAMHTPKFKSSSRDDSPADTPTKLKGIGSGISVLLKRERGGSDRRVNDIITRSQVRIEIVSRETVGRMCIEDCFLTLHFGLFL